VGTFVLEYHLTGHSCLAFLQNELPELLENVPLATRAGTCFQHDSYPTLLQCGDRHVNTSNTFPGQWIIHGSLDNCPVGSQNLSLHGLLLLVVDEKSGL
jgi:hypothetical protein